MGSPLLRNTTFLLSLMLILSAGSGARPQTTVAPELVQMALAQELAAARDTSHPVRFKLRKTSPRLTTTKEIVETRDGSVAMLVAVNDKALTGDDAAKEQVRLDSLLADPARQRRRKQTQDDDTARALKVLEAMPRAFIYTDAGPIQAFGKAAEKFTFVPNPRFNPPDLETQVLTQMAGEIWIDAEHDRAIRLDAHLLDDVDFGWGILGRLAKDGWITIDQGEVLPGIWRITRFEMKMNVRVLFRKRVFETTEEQSDFAAVPGMTYREAIAQLRGSPPAGR